MNGTGNIKKEDRKSGSGTRTTGTSFSEEEKAAMKERAREMGRKKRSPGKDKEDGESEVMAKISELPEPDRSMALRLHSIIKENLPELSSRTWYGMPAYTKDGKLICFFQSSMKFKTRYSTIGFSDKAKLDEGDMWPTSYALKGLNDTVESKILALINRAVGKS